MTVKLNTETHTTLQQQFGKPRIALIKRISTIPFVSEDSMKSYEDHDCDILSERAPHRPISATFSCSIDTNFMSYPY